MEQEASDELTGIKGHFFDFIVSFPVSVGKSDAAVIDWNDPIVWNGYPVSIPAKILKTMISYYPPIGKIS